MLLFSNRTYDILKWIALILLPALGALYFGLAQIWGFPYAEEIVGSISVVDTFLGVILGISTNNYNKINNKSNNKDDIALEAEEQVNGI